MKRALLYALMLGGLLGGCVTANVDEMTFDAPVAGMGDGSIVVLEHNTKTQFEGKEIRSGVFEGVVVVDGVRGGAFKIEKQPNGSSPLSMLESPGSQDEMGAGDHLLLGCRLLSGHVLTRPRA